MGPGEGKISPKICPLSPLSYLRRHTISLLKSVHIPSLDSLLAMLLNFQCLLLPYTLGVLSDTVS